MAHAVLDTSNTRFYSGIFIF